MPPAGSRLRTTHHSESQNYDCLERENLCELREGNSNQINKKERKSVELREGKSWQIFPFQTVLISPPTPSDPDSYINQLLPSQRANTPQLLIPAAATTLPLCFIRMGMAAVAEARHLAQDQQFHVLAVDDSIIDRKLIERLLKTSSYHVTAVDSGSKALEFLGLNNNNNNSSSSSSSEDGEDISLIITDYCMPGMSGYDLLRRIKESESFKDTPVVIMSSENVPSRINTCLQQGAQDFFLKPLQLSHVTKLKSHLFRCTTC
ncbi:unnamed protein product [Linum tenue]|uniref:Response regulatory domain-containing protein n=1 Tax=Linum tenue TaxID=586396 RepID=A0AAV0NUI5_9ROSI|nr:unnamed protein product [Linum tenue]